MTTATQRFALFPFEHKGFDFVSHVEIESNAYAQIANLSDGLFIQMNKSMINELLTITETSTHDEIAEQLEKINEGGTYAFLKLAGE